MNTEWDTVMAALQTRKTHESPKSCCCEHGKHLTEM